LEKLDRSDEARSQLRQSAQPLIKNTNNVVVVMTGSLGAKSVNTAVLELAKQWSTKDSLTLIHVTGRRDYEFVKNNAPVCYGLDYRIVPFGEMNELWGLCDVAITRAGAMTVGELCQLGIPSVVIPLPGSPGDHQTKNAEKVVASGGALMIRDAELNATVLASALESVIEKKITMGASIASLARANAAKSIATHVLEIAR
jgi:UDP-N-acetylglucosamine--N-acetylmuramyl-(pentapeptide) pyrophosphoryl-undecaprenol N-acetylglucosamine transferase